MKPMSDPLYSPTKLLQILSLKGLTISVAESITAGNIQSLISSVSGASNSFSGGITVYGIKSKVNILGVDKNLAISTNCVSDEIANQMALGAIKLFNTDISVSTCGYAEKSEINNVNKPFSFISIAMKSSSDAVSIFQCEKIYPNGDRIEVQKQVAAIALDKVFSALVKMANK